MIISIWSQKFLFYILCSECPLLPLPLHMFDSYITHIITLNSFSTNPLNIILSNILTPSFCNSIAKSGWGDCHIYICMYNIWITAKTAGNQKWHLVVWAHFFLVLRLCVCVWERVNAYVCVYIWLWPYDSNLASSLTHYQADNSSCSFSSKWAKLEQAKDCWL